MGVDTISAAEFLQLIQDEAAAKGLTDKKDYNAFLVMPDPADKLASLVFRIASGTQVLWRRSLAYARLEWTACQCIAVAFLPSGRLPLPVCGSATGFQHTR